MRIIGGTLGGRVMHPPLKKWPTRPTTDIAREALYNILANRIDFAQSIMLDLFAGTGAHSIEFISRGSKDVTYVDSHRKCYHWFKKEVIDLNIDTFANIVCLDVSKYIKKSDKKFDVIFADPPYALSWLPQIPDLIFEKELLAEEGFLIIEHDSTVNFSGHERCQEERKYGQSRFSFLG